MPHPSVMASRILVLCLALSWLAAGSSGTDTAAEDATSTQVLRSSASNSTQRGAETAAPAVSQGADGDAGPGPSVSGEVAEGVDAALVDAKRPNPWQVFRMLDRNRDGRLSPGELWAGIRQHGIRMAGPTFWSMFRRADGDRDGHLSYREFAPHFARWF
mmetsp:Transcript_120241/g.312092  ORF Transcript_120241/g.312092 Transcript_120241/m.312092 type:complete len:159 (-) Transcript_120241:117-593(-)